MSTTLFSSHRETHDAPGGYRVLLAATLPSIGEGIDIRTAAGWLACPWLAGGQPGQHTLAQAQASAVLKFLAVFLPDQAADGNFQVAETAAVIAGGPPDRGGLLHIWWPSGAKRHSFYWKSNTGSNEGVYVEMWFDVPIVLSPG